MAMPQERSIIMHPTVAKGPEKEAWVATWSIRSAVLCGCRIQCGAKKYVCWNSYSAATIFWIPNWPFLWKKMTRCSDILSSLLLTMTPFQIHNSVTVFNMSCARWTTTFTNDKPFIESKSSHLQYVCNTRWRVAQIPILLATATLEKQWDGPLLTVVMLLAAPLLRILWLGQINPVYLFIFQFKIICPSLPNY